MKQAASCSGCERNGEWPESISITLSTPTDSIMARCCAGDMAPSCVQRMYARGTDPQPSVVRWTGVDAGTTGSGTSSRMALSLAAAVEEVADGSLGDGTGGRAFIERYVRHQLTIGIVDSGVCGRLSILEQHGAQMPFPLPES
jgi:hypothetical protein